MHLDTFFLSHQSNCLLLIKDGNRGRKYFAFNFRHLLKCSLLLNHGLRRPSEEMAFTALPKINSQSQIFRYGQSIFCLPHRPNFSDIFNLCLHWESVVRGMGHRQIRITNSLTHPILQRQMRYFNVDGLLNWISLLEYILKCPSEHAKVIKRHFKATTETTAVCKRM